MYLKSLELSGFKSFAKKANLIFTSPITGIVGPNGSGKSNMAEAFRFVLGEQSIKSLRGKKGEDMIWNGGGDSLSVSRSNRASVKLTFDNSRRLFPSIDFEDVTIERVVNRDGVNEYLLNGSQVRLKDIVELLSTAHIGATGHHIISQGEADRILGASIRERREMIEDALGLKVYQWKKLESIRKLERTEENMKQVESLRREIAPHIKFLKKQVEKVEKAEELRKELIVLYREYFAYEDIYIKNEKEKINGELRNPREELQNLDNQLLNAKKIIAESQLADKKSEEVLNLEEKLKNVRIEKDGLVRELGRLDGEINANKRAIEKEQIRQKQEEFQTVYLRDVEEIVTKIETLRYINDVGQLFNEVITLLRTFITGHRSNTDSAFIGEASQEIKKLGEERSIVEIKITEIKNKEIQLTSAYQSLRETIEKEKDTDREAEKNIFKIIATQNELRNVISGLNNRLEIINRAESSFKQELGEAGIMVGREAVDYQTEIAKAVVGFHAEGSRQEQEDRKKKIEKNKIRLEDYGALGSSEVLKEYRETEERDTFLQRELEDLVKAKEELINLIKDLDIRIDLEFKSGITKINDEFGKYFTLMFGGGHAALEVVKEVRRKKSSDIDDLNSLLNEQDDSSESESLVGVEQEKESLEGLDVNISLPKKKVKGLMMLSGGERALTSIALLFAISQVNPPPFIILDETDAALDEANSRKYGDMIEDLSKRSQLILITHNRETMSRAGVIYGITMGADGASRLLSIAFEDAVAVAK